MLKLLFVECLVISTPSVQRLFYLRIGHVPILHLESIPDRQYSNSHNGNQQEAIMDLKKYRQSKGLTQKVVADHIGCSAVVYSRYETGDREPSIDMLIRIADVLDVAIDDIVGRVRPNTSGLTTYERTLLTTARKADERAKQDALLILEAHPEEHE